MRTALAMFRERACNRPVCSASIAGRRSNREKEAAVASAPAAARRAERAADVAIADARANTDDATARAEAAEQRAERALSTPGGARRMLLSG